MTDRDAFIAAIAANPQEDAPRLAFADWIEEQGDATRAGFIRDQVRLARMKPGSEEAKALFRRTADTLKANLPAWIQNVCAAFGQPVEWKPGNARDHGLPIRMDCAVTLRGFSQAVFERGFLEQVFIDTRPTGDGTPLGALLREHPVTRLRLRFPLPGDTTFKTVTEVKQIRSLTLTGAYGDRIAEQLLDDKMWSSLRWLTLGLLLWDGVGFLTRLPLMKQLHGLRVPLNYRYFVQLAKFPLDDSLRELCVFPSNFPIQQDRLVENISILSTIAFRPTLKKLDLAGCTIGDRGLATFARGELWIRLKSLVLDRNRFGDPGWRDFVRGRRTPELKALSANRNFLTRDGAVRLAQSPLAETLEWIDLRGNRIDGMGAIELARRLVESPLKKLLLAGNPIGEREAETVRKLLGERVTL
ncbi:MAG: TIGR02996 domain-containing protein [Gemmataceae bacterium]|nr:TIGR02996 domain-containing protein [Gemmataceae bacterium]